MHPSVVTSCLPYKPKKKKQKSKKNETTSSSSSSYSSSKSSNNSSRDEGFDSINSSSESEAEVFILNQTIKDFSKEN